MPRVAAHHLDEHHAVVRLGRGRQPVERVGHDVDRGLEAEGLLGRGEVVVDRLRYADHRDAASAIMRSAIRWEPSPPIETTPTRPSSRMASAIPPREVDRPGRTGERERIAAVGGAQHGAAALQEPPARGRGEGLEAPRRVEQAVERVFDPHDLEAVGADPCFTKARITAFNPGASPPPVMIPTRVAIGLPSARWSRRRPEGTIVTTPDPRLPACFPSSTET